MKIWRHLADNGPEYIIGTFGLLVVLTIVGFAFLAKKDCEKYNRLLAQCLADGRKEYECVSMLQQSRASTSTLVPIPIIVPARGR
jgi:hypothetical protein